MCPFKEGGM